jgi:diacylglycerol kinase (ATP)
VPAFADARPDDGHLQVGVVTAKSRLQWTRVLALMVANRTKRSKFVTITRARKIDVRLSHKAPYELDGGDRKAVKRLRVRVEPGAIVVSTPTKP